jgi:CubicO group peptidase (beta-lactamase class C family)
LLGGNPNRPLDDRALAGWSKQVEGRLTRPLGMKHTVLNPPSGQSARGVAGGYDQALVTAQVSGGQITGLTRRRMEARIPFSQCRPRS